MKEFSKEIINIAGKDYTLFLNRKGIVAWEKFAKEENRKMEEVQQRYNELFNGSNEEITDETNPFENIEDIENDSDSISNSYRKLYWIMLYENHKLSLTQVNELYDKAMEEYGEVQLIALATQMIEDANKNGLEEEEDKKKLKNLPALKPRKK